MSKWYAMIDGHEYELEETHGVHTKARAALAVKTGQGLLPIVVRNHPVSLVVNLQNVSTWSVYSIN